MKKVLSVFLVLSGTMAIGLSLTCITSYPRAIALLKLPDSPGLRDPIGLFGAALIPAGMFQVIAAYWVFKMKQEGIVLAKFAGALLITTGLVITLGIKRPDLGLADLVKGILILLLVFLAQKKKVK